jgi:hypothetical protein
LLSSVRSQELAACFTSASVAKQLASQVFVKGSKVMKITGSLGLITRTGIPTGYGPTAASLRPPSVQSRCLTQRVPFLCSVGMRFVTDVAVKRAVTSSTDVDADFFRSGIQAKERQMFKCDWRLRGSLMCFICYPCATCMLQFSAIKCLLHCLWNSPCICVVYNADSEGRSG